MSVDQIFTIFSLSIALLSVIVSLYSVRQARNTALTETYFSEMASAYSGYLCSISDFVYRRGTAERDALVASLYRLQLFASSKISRDAQEIYVYLLDWASSNPNSALDLDKRVNALGSEMRSHLDLTRKRGKP